MQPLAKAMGRRITQTLRPRAEGPAAVWGAVIAKDPESWQRALKAADGQRVLMATSMGGYDHGTGLESVLTAALTLRGAQVDVLLCDEFLPACQLTKFSKISPERLVARGQRTLCRPCFASGQKAYDALGRPVLTYSANVSDSERDMASRLSQQVPLAHVPNWRFEGLAVGEHAMAGALRYYGRGDLHGEDHSEQVVRRFLEAGLLTVFASRRILDLGHYGVAVFHHGIYIPQGIIGEVCRQRGVRVVNSNPAYRDKCFIFSHETTYHHTMISEDVKVWRDDMDWHASTRTVALDYLMGRRQGRDDWIHFNQDPLENASSISAETGLNFSRPTVALLTNVLWDAQLHYPSNAFPDMLAWLFHTVEKFRDLPDYDLAIRIHPAEVTGAVPSRQPLLSELNKRFPALPDNVYVIKPESKVSTYELIDHSIAALIYNTKTGIEIAAQGKPVVVAGEAWIRGKGFAFDVNRLEEYDALLERIQELHMTDNQVELARRYAYHFFFRRMIPLSFMESPERFHLKVALDSLDQLAEGRESGLDIICRGILKGSAFVYPAELSMDK